MFRFEQLEIWKLSISYAKRIYVVTEKFPKSEVFGITSQLRRAGVSISSNIAEGSGSSTVRDFCNFIDIAIKSTLEIVSQLYLALELQLINKDEFDELYEKAEELIRKMRAFKASLKKRDSR